MVHTKVFVGNLDFKTTEEELAQEFSEAGKVISANIITRGPRSLGYGFVELDNEKDAANAVSVMNKKKVNGREINVELAKLREPNQEGNNQSNGNAPRRGGFRSYRGNYRRGGYRGSNANNPTNNEGNEEGNEEVFRRKRRNIRPRNSEDNREQKPRERRERPPRRPIEERNSTPSKTTLFVANLPFALNDEDFGKVFKEEGLSFKTAHVVKKRNNRSKGFGFVEFDDEKDQQKALGAVNNKIVNNRELVVKIALTEIREPRGEEGKKEEEKPEPKKEEKKPEPKKEAEPKKDEKKQDKKEEKK